MQTIRFSRLLLLLGAAILWIEGASCRSHPHADVLIKNGMIYDGSGNPPFQASIAISGDSIIDIGALTDYEAKTTIDAKGLAVAPGFINVLSWAAGSLFEDGRGQSDTRQGVTMEIFGEGESGGPLNAGMKAEYLKDFPIHRFDTSWTTLGGFLSMMENKVTPNIASFVGATTIRKNVIGFDDRPPTPEELERMKALVREAMEEGALGLGTSLIYPPAFYAKTDELIAMAKVVGEYKGAYISHMRSEGNQLLESIDELIRIAAEAKVPAEIYHLKMAGENNWYKYDAVIKKIDSARKAGLRITTDMYTYHAAGTGLSATMPPWAQEGGFYRFLDRLGDPATRKRIIREMQTPTNKWENMFLSNGGPSGILLCGFRNKELRKYIGKTLEEVAAMRNQSPADAAVDLIREDSSRIGAIYFMMSEENVRKQIQLPYMSFGSDEGSLAPEGEFLQSNPHPRAYGSFARLLGKYVREEKLIPLEEAVRKLTSLPATNFQLTRRGALKKGYYADIVVFNPDSISDHASFARPHQYSTGMVHVYVNGTQVLKEGEHTGATPGRFVKGPGWNRGN